MEMGEFSMVQGIQCGKNKLRVGLLINPYAGYGGPQGLKGSDNIAAHPENLKDFDSRATLRAKQCLEVIQNRENIQWVTTSGVMGAAALRDLIHGDVDFILEHSTSHPTTAEDTKEISRLLKAQQIDVLVFVGGDGTARDVCAAISTSIPVLGVPAGVKMHSGVFAISPLAAARVIEELASGQLVAVDEEEVRDIDEASFQKGIVKSQHYGYMLVPQEHRFIQHVKQGGVEQEELVLLDIANDIRERMEDEAEDTLYIFAPGSTTHFVLEELGCSSTLLGVDVYQYGEIKLADACASDLEAFVEDFSGKIVLVLTAIGGQGHIIGRGNQQLSPALLKRIGRDQLWIVATKTKILALDSRPLIIDSNDPELDLEWQGFIPVITGYRDTILYRVGSDEENI